MSKFDKIVNELNTSVGQDEYKKLVNDVIKLLISGPGIKPLPTKQPTRPTRQPQQPIRQPRPTPFGPGKQPRPIHKPQGLR